MKKYLSFAAFALLTMAMTFSLSACGDDDEDGGKSKTNASSGSDYDNTNANDNGTYLATYDIKTITCIDGSSYSYYNEFSYTAAKKCFHLLYEDYNYAYFLYLCNGIISVMDFTRVNGSWCSGSVYGSSYSVGNVGGLSGIQKPSEQSWYAPPTCTFQPNCGYRARMKKSDKTWLYLRYFTTGYTLDSNGKLKTVTLQYQLF